MDKVLCVKKNPISLDGLSNSFNYFFSDGTSVFLWYSSLVNYYLVGKMKEEEVVAFLDMYKCSLKEDDFSSTILYLQMVLKMKDKDSFCSFLGIKPYLYKNLCHLRCDEKVITCIIRNLSSKDFSSFSELQKKEIQSFCAILKEKGKESIIKCEKNISSEKARGNIKDWQNRINEILQYLDENPVSAIPENMVFADGCKMNSWYHQNLRRSCISYLDVDKLEIQKGRYQVAKKLYNAVTIPPHKRISLDYGSSLRRVFFIYYRSLEQIAVRFKLPKPFLLSILENKLVPNEEFISSVLSFLKELSFSDDYQKEFVLDAIVIYENLKSLHLEGDSFPFYYYSADREEEYLALWKVFDSSILERVKENHYDWYIKCLTYFFICKEKGRKPTRDEYFYDGTYCYKWLTTQKRVLLDKMDFSIDSDQQAMLRKILNEVALIEVRKDNNKSVTKIIRKTPEELVFEKLDDFLVAIEKSVSTYGKILPDLTLNQVKLYKAWRIICRPLMQKEVPFSDKQLAKIKEIRHKMIFNSKRNRKTFNGINFGYELTCFIDGLHFSLSYLSEQFSISQCALTFYSVNKNLPNLAHVEKMLSFLEGLDLSLYRKDQKKDIICFKNVLHSLKKYLEDQADITKENDFLSLKEGTETFTGNLLRDIPISYLKEIHDADIVWYEEFKALYKDVCRDAKEDTITLSLSCRRWFKNEVHKMSLDNYSPIKEKLLRYLYFVYQKSCVFKRENSFLYKFIPLSNFIYEHERLPQRGELLLMDNKDGRAFYDRIIKSFCGNKGYYEWQSDSLKEQMKLLIQYVAFCRRKKYDYQKDKIEEDKLFLGERLENIRICLGFSRESFANKMGWSKEEMHVLYSNRISLKEQHVESLLQLFEEMKGKKLRRDQLEEMQEFIQVLRTKKLEDGFAFKFCPKE